MDVRADGKESIVVTVIQLGVHMSSNKGWRSRQHLYLMKGSCVVENNAMFLIGQYIIGHKDPWRAAYTLSWTYWGCQGSLRLQHLVFFGQCHMECARITIS